MYCAVICDDDPQSRKRIIALFEKAGLSADKAYFREYVSGKELMAALKGDKTDETVPKGFADLYILDIQLDGMDGYDIAVEIRKRFADALIVLCSGVYQPRTKDFKVRPYRYLLKGEGEEKLLVEIGAVIKEMDKRASRPVIVGKHYYNDYKFTLDEILYFRITKNGSVIVPLDTGLGDVKIKTRLKLQELERMLQPYGFASPHNSYLVNLRYVRRHQYKEAVVLENGEEIRVSRGHGKDFAARMGEYYGTKY